MQIFLSVYFIRNFSTFCREILPLAVFLFCMAPTTLENGCYGLASYTDDGGAILFGTGAAYASKYDAAIHWPQYQKATLYHLDSLKSIPENGTVIEAGGGTGNMTVLGMKMRPEAEFYLVDYNPEMAKFAEPKGIPAGRMSLGPELGDIRHLHLSGKPAANGSADLIFSHSVLWNLSDPHTFFAEAARVLKPGGILSVSTIRSDAASIAKWYAQGMWDGFEPAVKKGRLKKEDIEVLITSSEKVISSIGQPGSLVKSTMIEDDVYSVADRFGFKLIDISECYMVNTPTGEKPVFIQFKLQKI